MKGQISKVESLLTWCEIDKLRENKDIRLGSPGLSWRTEHSVSRAAQCIRPSCSFNNDWAHRPAGERRVWNALEVFLWTQMKTGLCSAQMTTVKDVVVSCELVLVYGEPAVAPEQVPDVADVLCTSPVCPGHGLAVLGGLALGRPWAAQGAEGLGQGQPVAAQTKGQLWSRVRTRVYVTIWLASLQQWRLV